MGLVRRLMRPDAHEGRHRGAGNRVSGGGTHRCRVIIKTGVVVLHWEFQKRGPASRGPNLTWAKKREPWAKFHLPVFYTGRVGMRPVDRTSLLYFH